ncbi:MAG: DUF4838 domain-containing protein [Clostridia bacterium]|nr:DUF4838 domain-containing protein [Clostridia bacterium]
MAQKKNGLLIHPEEISEYWENLILSSGVDSVGIHPRGGSIAHETLSEFLSNLKSGVYDRFLRVMKEHGMEVELECHALSWLLPRENFDAHPDWFRMEEDGVRTPKNNLCPSSEEALAVVEERSALLASLLPFHGPYYHIWIDDTSRNGTCHCERCRSLSPSDQALTIYHAILRGLKRYRSDAKLGFLAYHETMIAPTVPPMEGMYLEYAPIHRRVDRFIGDPNCEENKRETAHLCELLEVFGREDAEVLEYWLDNSLFCGWKLPYKKLNLDEALLREDLKYYRGKGFSRITTFACFLGEDYAKEFGTPPIDAYGRILKESEEP